MERKILKINKNGETLTITKSASETNGQLTEFEGTDQPGVGPTMHKSNKMTKIQNSNFKRLIGIWDTEGTFFAGNGNLKLIGIDSYEFILNGNYILHKADVKIGDEKSETFEIITLDSSVENGKMQYYNSKGENGVMTSSLTKNNFKIKGDKIKFEGTINEENTILTGNWFLQADNDEWTEFIDLKLTKQI